MIEYFKEVMNTDFEIGITTEASCYKKPEMLSDTLTLNEYRGDLAIIKEDYMDDKKQDISNLEDNMKYFEHLNEDEDYVDFDTTQYDFSRFRSQRKEYRFEDIVV